MISLRQIQAFANRIAAEFSPRRIILFGSYANGTPTADSDVDLMVEVPYRGHPARKAAEIVVKLDPRFPLDLIVRSPQEVKRRVALNDWFMLDVVTKGKLLYERRNGRVGRQGRR